MATLIAAELISAESVSPAGTAVLDAVNHSCCLHLSA